MAILRGYELHTPTVFPSLLVLMSCAFTLHSSITSGLLTTLAPHAKGIDRARSDVAVFSAVNIFCEGKTHRVAFMYRVSLTGGNLLKGKERSLLSGGKENSFQVYVASSL